MGRKHTHTHYNTILHCQATHQSPSSDSTHSVLLFVPSFIVTVIANSSSTVVCCFLRYELYTVCALRAVHRVLVLGSLPASGMKDIQIQISDDRHRRHAANLATKTQPIFRSHTRWLLFPERKRLCEIENGGFSICNFSFSISHKSRP